MTLKLIVLTVCNFMMILLSESSVIILKKVVVKYQSISNTSYAMGSSLHIRDFILFPLFSQQTGVGDCSGQSRAAGEHRHEVSEIMIIDNKIITID